MAFVSSFASLKLSSTTSTFVSTRTAAVPFRAQAPAPRRLSPMRMADELKDQTMAEEVVDKVREEDSTFQALESNREVKQESDVRGPQGFTPFAERVNGQAAQIGFLATIIIEIVTGRTINEQILFILSPILKLFNLA